ncbi:PorT family protein [Cryomorpha ignava]|uniref:PorT family protein n=1 Tax=Cryomorpha ignava TaxID=101383 RepID=A0A7K3WLH3_9FLAO|nr:porin family protein [Cryomorpha ignava]NEN21891.1 PorT family protein [Cryomorpha ignava]
MKKHIYCKYKVLIIILLLLWRSDLLLAQDSGSSAFNLDIHAGITASQVQGDGLSGFNKLGFTGGLGITTTFSTKWDGGFELNLIQKGSIKRPDPDAGNYTKYSMLLNYIQIPVYGKYKVNSKLSFLAGPAIGILISSKEEDMNGELTGTPDFEKLELALILGAEYSFSEKWAAQIRLEQSLLPIRSKGDYSSNTLKGRQYSTVLGVLISYSIR